MRLSVIIPMLEEAASIEAAVRSAREADEVIAVDGGSIDASCALAARHGAVVVCSERGRGRQLASGVSVASGDVLLFLHADSVLPEGFRDDVLTLVERGGSAWGRFDVRFDEGGPLLRLIAWLISTRSRISRVATGDQGIFVTRRAYDAVGGFREPELFEDIDLCRRLKRYGSMAVPRARLTTSSRRWRQDGVWATTALMWTMKTLYLCGMPASTLARWYRRVR